jgi:hypothetical protein
VRWPLETALAAVCAILFYQGSVGKAANWGAQVKSVFDLYRWDLLKKIGYQQAVSSRHEERDLWKELSAQFIYGDPLVDLPFPYASPAKARSLIEVIPADLEVELTSGVREGFFGRRTHTYQITNKDGRGRTAERITLNELLPEGLAYMWRSAKKNGSRISALGTNPYTFAVGSLRPNETVEICYSTVSNNH